MRGGTVSRIVVVPYVTKGPMGLESMGPGPVALGLGLFGLGPIGPVGPLCPNLPILAHMGLYANKKSRKVLV